MIGLRRIAGSRTDTLIGLEDQLLVGQHLILGVTPELAAHALMHPLGKRLCEPVRERLDHDAPVVVGLLDVRLDRLVLTDAGGDRESADEVLAAAVLRRDEVG